MELISYFHKKAIKVPLYRGWFVIILSNYIPKVKKLIPVFDDEEIFAHAIYGNYKGMQGFFMVLNFDNTYSKITPGSIAHEALHIMNFIVDARGIIPTFENDEPLAYLIEWIVNQSYMFIDKSGFKV